MFLIETLAQRLPYGRNQVIHQRLQQGVGGMRIEGSLVGSNDAIERMARVMALGPIAFLQSLVNWHDVAGRQPPDVHSVGVQRMQ
jgi:hypothetical protein